jgi:hypothetical protein
MRIMNINLIRFCLGFHPCFNGKNNTVLQKLDGSKGSKNFII